MGAGREGTGMAMALAGAAGERAGVSCCLVTVNRVFGVDLKLERKREMK